jgi:hypothetical protein
VTVATGVYDEDAPWQQQNYPGISSHRDKRAAERAILQYKRRDFEKAKSQLSDSERYADLKD